MRKLRQLSRRSKVWLVTTMAGAVLSIASSHAGAVASKSVREPVSLILLGTGLIGLARAQRAGARDRSGASPS